MMKKICMISFVLHFAAAGSGCASGNDKKAAEAAPAKVYMTRDISPAGMKAVYEALGRKAEGKKVAVKLSTGEPGGNNFLQPALIGDLVKSVKGTIVECNTAYGGGRAKTEDHLKAAADHGFTAIAPVDIMDAEGEVRLPVEGGRHLKYDIVGSHFPEYDFVVVLSHFKGHAMGGLAARSRTSPSASPRRPEKRGFTRPERPRTPRNCGAACPRRTIFWSRWPKRPKRSPPIAANGFSTSAL